MNNNDFFEEVLLIGNDSTRQFSLDSVAGLPADIGISYIDDADLHNQLTTALEGRSPLMFVLDARGMSEHLHQTIDQVRRLSPDIFFVVITDDAVDAHLLSALNKEIIHGILSSEPGSPEKLHADFVFLVRRARKQRQSQNILSEMQESLWKLNQIGIALSVEHNLDKLLDLILREARRFTRSDAGSLYIVRKDYLSFELAHNDTLDRKLNTDSRQTFKAIPLPLSTNSIAGYTALTGSILNIFDAYDLPAAVPFTFDKSFDERTGYRTKSMLVVPMRDDRDKIIGVLQLINPMTADGRIITFQPHHEDLVKSLASQAAIAIRNASLIKEIKTLLTALIDFSSSVIDARSAYTAGHSRRIAQLVTNIAHEINRQKSGPFGDVNFSPDELVELSYAAYLHDIGKIGVPEHMLDKRTKINEDQLQLVQERFRTTLLQKERDFLATNDERSSVEWSELCQTYKQQIEDNIEFITKINIPGFLSDDDTERLHKLAELSVHITCYPQHPIIDPPFLKNLAIKRGNLTDEERLEIEKHILHSIKILAQIPFPEHLARVPDIAAAHHEKLDGTGYPKGLKAEQLSLQARILAVADFFDALTAKDRPYKKPLSPERTIAILRDEAAHNKLESSIIELLAACPHLYEDVI